MNLNQAEDLFTASINITDLDNLAIENAKTCFVVFQNDGVIKKKCRFEDDVWFTTNEYANIGLHFKFNRFSYSQYQNIFHLDFDEFILYVKAYLTLFFGKNALDTLQTLLLDLRHIIGYDLEGVQTADPGLTIHFPAYCADFFAMLPGADDNDELETLMHAMEVYRERWLSSNSCEKNQRVLADFDTYFRFDDIMKDFWRSPLSNDERLFYYPLYLWWEITGVLPLRPREFLLTERKCLAKDIDGNYSLHLRRNQLKGSGRSISYKISDDYIVETYNIPQTLGREIERYLTLTEEHGNTDLNTLFVTDPHYMKWGQHKRSDSRYLTYVNMNTILRYFYRDIIAGKHKLHVLQETKNQHLADNEIGRIHLGDTRHIALINIMQEGGTPVTAMLLAGHDNMITASHYYSNVENLIESKTYRMHRKMISGDNQYHLDILSQQSRNGHGKPLRDGGECVSPAYQSGKIDDCLDSTGANGEIGYCPTCKHYRNAGGYDASEDIYKRNLYNDCVLLTQAVEIIRKGQGSTEDLGEALLRFRSSSLSYQEYLLSKRTRGENATWQEEKR